MPIKIAVCDDEIQSLNQIDTYLHQIEEEAGIVLQTFYFSNGEDVLAHMPRDIDVVLLDIKMSTLSGIEVARRLRDEGASFYLFFITSNPQYALEGYSVHAYAFLCKPVQYAELKTYLLEVFAQIDNHRPYLLELKNGSESKIVDCNDLVYIEVYGHTCIAVLDHGERITCKTPLDKLEDELRSRGFFRCHKSYLVNLHKITCIRPSEVVMSDGTPVSLSRPRKQDFLIAFKEIMGK